MSNHNPTGVVFDIKEFAVFDGPGIRTTVFMKGCPLRCQWCHNPEGLSPRPQLMVSRAACIHCGACESVCPTPGKCIACGKCIPHCRGGYRKIIGAEWTADDLAARLLKDRDIYESSQGGVTFSGGEPLMQWDFISGVIDKMPGIHTAIETSGYAPDEIFASAMEKCALIMMDWKLSDPVLHKRYTGVDQAPILRHLQWLAAGDTPFILRMPIIPGVNDYPDHFRRAAELAANSKALIRVDLLPYQQAAGAKYEMVGREYKTDFDGSIPPRFYPEFFEEKDIPYKQFK